MKHTNNTRDTRNALIAVIIMVIMMAALPIGSMAETVAPKTPATSVTTSETPTAAEDEAEGACTETTEEAVDYLAEDYEGPERLCVENQQIWILKALADQHIPEVWDVMDPSLEEGRIAIKEILENGEEYYEISIPYQLNGVDLDAYFYYSNRLEKHFISPKVVVSSLETFEHVIVVSREHLNAATWEELKSFVEPIESTLVTPSRRHMYSYITLIILADQIDDDMEPVLRRYRYAKNYKFTLHGWSEVHVAAVNLSNNNVIGSRPAKRTIKYCKKAFSAQL